jgi:hypothetical protein
VEVVGGGVGGALGHQPPLLALAALVFEPTTRAIDGLEKALAGLGLPDDVRESMPNAACIARAVASWFSGRSIPIGWAPAPVSQAET